MPYPFAARLAKDMLETAPALVRLPLSKVPFAAKAALIKPMLSLLLADEAKAGELDFLTGQWVGIEVKDLGLCFEVSFDGAIKIQAPARPQVQFSANSRELLLIAAGKEDPDTLFFQRRLTIEGDTELGLMVKNMLLAIDLGRLPAPVKTSLNQLANALVALEQRAEPAWA